jgi:hypothetical protein
MRDKLFIIKAKQNEWHILAKNKDYAFAKFFKDVADDKIHLSELDNIIILTRKNAPEGSEIPFRTVPLLYQMKLLSAESAVSNIMAVTGATQKEAEDMLMKESYADSRLIPFIELRRSERC